MRVPGAMMCIWMDGAHGAVTSGCERHVADCTACRSTNMASNAIDGITGARAVVGSVAPIGVSLTNDLCACAGKLECMHVDWFRCV